MAIATLSLSKKANAQGEHQIIVRLDITRTNRPQFKTRIAVKPEYLVDGEIRIPPRSKFNAQVRDDLVRKKTAIETYVASLRAISTSLPEEACTRKDILDVYEVVKSVAPSEISRTTIIAKKREQGAANADLVRQLVEARRPGVMEYFQKRLDGMRSGTIKRKGNNYTDQTLRCYAGFLNVLDNFMTNRPFDWEDIGEQLIDEFVLYMENYGYMKKTINKNLAVFSAFLNAAFKEGFRFKTSVLSHFPKLHVTREDKVTEIYLTEEELDALYAMPLSGDEDKVRDVFLVGCYTCQRYSDYSRITERNVSFHDGVGIITLTQQKTGTEVSIPILNDNLVRILEKYDYNLPHIDNSELNDRIKDILKRLSATVPSLGRELPTKLTLVNRKLERDNKVQYRRNGKGEALIPKYSLVTTHTARRTGITLMYLSRVLDSREMMSISGHKTESVFNDYIKISGVELATSIAKKVARARKERLAKAALMEQIEKMSSEQIARMLETANAEQAK
ncbi:MAG: site-specific integrase [Bacteroidales bacterium]|nr:site-specific integrase [Bacteroidales bacterium]